MFKNNFSQLVSGKLTSQKAVSCECSKSMNTKPNTKLWALALIGILFTFGLSYSQIIVESGSVSAGFGVDADVQTDGT